MNTGEKNALINNEESKNDFAFIENIFQKPSIFLKDAKNKICNWKICTRIPLSLCFFMIATLFLLILLGSFFLAAILLMKSLYIEINELYFTNFVIDPIINKKTNKTEIFNIRNEILDELYLQSKLSNLEIASEFIIENLFANGTNNNMTSHITENNFFKSIMIDTNQIKDGQKLLMSAENEENEKDYFIYESGVQNDDSDYSVFNYNLFSALTHYLKLFESNLNFDIFNKNFISIKEIFIFNQDINNNYKILLTYCHDWDNSNGLIEAMFNKENTFKSIINEMNTKIFNISYFNSKNEHEIVEKTLDFFQYITRNDFQENINQLNLLKFKTFNITYNQNKYNILIGIRLDPHSMINLFNKQNSNMTTLLPVTDFISDNSNINSYVIHLLYDNKYFNDFFEYGLKNILYSSPLKINSQFSDEIDYQNTNIKNFFNILYYYEARNNYLKVLYNEIWEDEFVVIGQLIKKIVGDEYFLKLSCDKDEKDYENIMCDIIKNLVTSESNVSFGEIPTKDEGDLIFYDLNKTASFIHQKLSSRCTIKYILIKNVFTDLEDKKSNIKLFYYNITLNNLLYHNIEVLNITTYNSVKEDFIKEMEDIEFIVILIRIFFTLIFLIVTLIKITREVFSAIKRINSIISLKDMLFNKTEVKFDEEKENEDLLYNGNDKDKYDSSSTESEKEEKEDLLEEQNEQESSSEKDEDKKLLYDNIIESEKEKDKLREKWSKAHFYENNFFPDGNKMIIKYTYNKLKNILENMDNCQSEKFNEKLVFLKRRYKLNEQNEDKEDCELSSDIYEAISKISIINFDDIFYNVYYNQSYALNQSFKMFKSILDSSINKQSIPMRNNKFINFGRILKIIYYFKKEKIQKIIEIIFDKDLKYKQQIIKKISIEENEALNEIINLTRRTARSPTKKIGRRSFIQDKK